MPNPFSTVVQPMFDDAISRNQPAKVSIALKLGADPNFPTSSPPLHKACQDGNLPVAKILVEAGANVNAVDSNGDTPLMAALRGTTNPIFKDKPASNEMLVGTATGAAKAWRPGGKQTEVAAESTTTWVLDDGGNIADKAGTRGQSRLPATAPEIVTLLLTAGAKANYSTTTGKVFRQTPLMLAAQLGIVTIVRSLILAGASVKAFDSDGDTVLMYAAAAEDSNVVNVILAAKPDKNAQNVAGFTALHIAVQYDRSKAVSILLGAGADMTIRNKRGVTPGEFAVANRSVASAKVILANLQAGASQAPVSDVSVWFQTPVKQAPAPTPNATPADAETARKKIVFRKIT